MTMKKLAIITKNKIFAQSLLAAMKARPNMGFELILLFNFSQALLDAEIFKIDIALIDMTHDTEEKEITLSFCKELQKYLPSCRILLLVSQNDKLHRQIASDAKKKKIVEDFMFYDSSLKYLLAKLSAL